MKKLFLITILIYSAAAFGQAWSGILDSSRAIDWSAPGVTGGIPTRNTVCATISAYTGTAAAINSAIASCGSGQVVSLGSGTFNLSTGIDFANHSNVTLRGAGPNLTHIVATGNAGCQGTTASAICVEDGSGNWSGGPQHTTTISSGYTQGSTSLVLASTANITAGTTALILDQLNDTSDGGFVWVCETMGTCSQEPPAGGERSGRAQQQTVLVTSVVGSTVTISPPIYMANWASGKSPGAWWATTPVQYDGVEDLSVDSASSGGNAGISFVNARNCWVARVTGLNTPRSQVWIYTSSRITVRDSYFYNSVNHASESYGIEFYITSDDLVENNIFQLISTPLQYNSAMSGTVIGYNFSVGDEFTQTTGWLIEQLSQHAAGIDYVLAEGNQGQGNVSDDVHGTHSLVTDFRNYLIGNGSTVDCNGTACNQQTIPGHVFFGSRIYNFVGNVMGQSGYHSNYEWNCSSTGSNKSDVSIWSIGWFDDQGTGSCDANVGATLMRWGNYDTVTGTSRFVSAEVPSGIAQYANAVPASTSLPASFYLSSKPSFFGSRPFPLVGPDVTGGNISNVGGHVYSNAARDCYLTTMGGNALGSGGPYTFVPSTCYPPASTNPVVPRVSQGIF